MNLVIRLSFIFLCGYGNIAIAQCSPDDLLIREVRAKDTDSDIAWELHKHFTYFNPSCVSRHQLLVHLPGTADNPQSTNIFSRLSCQ